MKKLAALILLAIGIPLTAQSFDIPTGGSSEAAKVKAVTKEATKQVTTSAINDKLKKENCQFVKDKSDEVTCDLNKVLKDLSDWKSGLETTGVTSDFDIHAEASADNNDLAWKRVSFVEGKLKARVSYWDWWSHKTTDNGDTLRIWITQD